MAIGINKLGARAGVTLASSLVVLTSSLAMQRALAQEDGEDSGELVVEEVVVQGTRQSLQNAQDIKRDADTFVDAISSSDIGSLPDRSVLEAMQRLPGVSIERFAAKNDPDHFSAEGSGAVVRGMTATRTEFNGRDSFTANSGRGLSFQDVPPELMGSVKLYKNQSADMIEGGIGGTVSLHTRLPFDQDGQVFSVSVDSTYYDLNEVWSPSVSGLYSNRWEVDGLGEFGLLVGIANSKSDSRSDGIQAEAFQERYESLYNPAADPESTVWVPAGSNVSLKEDNRERNGTSISLQWADTSDTILATASYLKSDSSLSWTENKISYQGEQGVQPLDDARIAPMEGTAFQFDDQGVFTRGFLANGDGWRAGGADNERIPPGYDTDSVCWDDPLNADCSDRSRTFGNRMQTTSRFKDQRTIVEDYAFNLKITPSDAWEIAFDYQHVDATTRDDDVEIFLGTNAVQVFDVTGDVPTMSMVNPWTSVSDTTKDELQNGSSYPIDPDSDTYFTDPSSYWWKAAMDHYERSEGEMDAGRIDVTRYFEDSFITSVQAGVRHAKRQQLVAFSRYNWDQIAEIFGNGHSGKYPEGNPYNTNYEAGWLDLPISESLTGRYGEVDWNGFYRGGTFGIRGADDVKILHPTRQMAKEYRYWGQLLDTVVKPDEWVPAAERDIDNDGQFDTIGYFLPSEFSDVVETNNAAYVRFDFESEAFGKRYTGNFGLRYFRVDLESAGYVSFPDLRPEYADPNTPEYYEDYRNFWRSDDGYDQIGFGNGGSQYSVAENSYDDFLPSLNVKMEFTDDLLGRFAVSKAVAMPDIGIVRNYISISGGSRVEIAERGDDYDDSDTLQPNEIEYAELPNGWTASAGNPYMVPMESIQYDASLEWYFADVGSLTGSLFYKDLSNFFVDGAFPRNITNEETGVTQVVNVDGAVNSEDGALAGFELAYQQFYDFLPEPWDGLGMQFNYTYIDAESVPNPGLAESSDVPADEDERENREGDVIYDSLPLESQSEHTANLVGMFEKGDWSFRVAYNWRSRYLVTARDVITPNRPIWSADAGYMDASLFYNITDEIKFGIQGTNLTNTITKTEMQVRNDGWTQGRSWFTNDRRYALILRATF